jgi:hypothetical protein
MVDVQVLQMSSELIVKSVVVWDHPSMLSPCPSFHAPEDLVNLGCPLIENLFDEDEEGEDDGEGEEDSENESEAEAQAEHHPA